MARATAQNAAATALRILDAAEDRFAAVGFAAVSLDEVARLAGVTRGAVYHHYTDRPGLFRAVAERAQRAVAARVVDAAEREGSPGSQLRAGCHAFLDAITSGSAARLLLVDAPAVLGWNAWRDADAASSGRELREGLAALATIADDQLDAMTQLLSGAMNDAALWIAEGATESRRTSAHAALDRLLDAVTPPGQAPSPRRS